jgi:AcrR family transcriptional regulator
MVTSRQTERSRQTDLKVAASAANAVRRDGVDQLALTRVASDAGYSSGVIYARCDDRSELMVLAWQRSFWPSVSVVLEAALLAAENRDENAMDRAVSAWRALCDPVSVPDAGSAVEVIVAARRDEVLGEVVHHDLNMLLATHGAAPGTDGPQRQLAVLVVATLLGTALMNSATPAADQPAIDPGDLLRLFCRPPDTDRSGAAPGTAEADDFERPRTGDEVRDSLIDATEYVISRSGVHRATVSRIARRAGVSVGAIYGLYENKESLVLDCVELLHLPQTERDIAAFTSMNRHNLRGTVAANLRAHLSAERSLWRQFRLECLVAARHTPALARMLGDFRSSHLESINHDIRVPLLDHVPARATIVGLAVLATADPTLTGVDWNWFPIG